MQVQSEKHTQLRQSYGCPPSSQREIPVHMPHSVCLCLCDASRNRQRIETIHNTCANLIKYTRTHLYESGKDGRPRTHPHSHTVTIIIRHWHSYCLVVAMACAFDGGWQSDARRIALHRCICMSLPHAMPKRMDLCYVSVVVLVIAPVVVIVSIVSVVVVVVRHRHLPHRRRRKTTTIHSTA